ncbi:DUF2267 domain-containing protein [Streptomyces deserti]
MDHDTFIGQVQARARLDSRGTAEAATRATLETLTERIPASLADHLAAQLPREISEHLRRVATAPDQPDTGIRMGYDDFLDRVAPRAGTDKAKATHEARTVMGVVGEAPQGGLTQKVRQALDDELARVLFAGSTGTIT